LVDLDSIDEVSKVAEGDVASREARTLVSLP
jgi:hypothetical protein